jgi:hypothetical protein
MTSKLAPAFDVIAAADVEPRRAVRGGSKAKASPRLRNDWRLVPVEEVLFAEMDQPALASPFLDTEIDRLATAFGLSTDEIAELYPRAALKPAAAAEPHRPRARSTRALSPSICTGCAPGSPASFSPDTFTLRPVTTR